MEEDRQRTSGHFSKCVALRSGDFISLFRMDVVIPCGMMLSNGLSLLGGSTEEKNEKLVSDTVHGRAACILYRYVCL